MSLDETTPMKRSLSLKVAVANLVLLGALTAAAMVILARETLPDMLFSPAKLRWSVLGVVVVALVALVSVPLVTLVLAIVDFRRGYRTQGLVAGALSLGVLLVPLLWVGLGGRFASQEEKRVNQAWGEVLDPMDAFTDRYPDGPPSDGLLKFEVAASRIGLQVLPPGPTGTKPVSPERQAYEVVSKALEAFVSSELDKSDQALGPPPDDVRAWLAVHELGVNALEAQVITGGPIGFETAWSGDPSQLPTVFGLREPHSVLLLAALEHERSGNSNAAINAIDAAWHLGGAVRERGEFISQMIACALDGRVVSALRKVTRVPAPWLARIAEHDYRLSTLRALEGEAWHMSAVAKRSIRRDQWGSVSSRLFWRPIQAPYIRLMATNYSEALRVLVAELKKRDSCVFDSNALD